MITHRYSEANNPYLKEKKPEQNRTSKYFIYHDVNNLYRLRNSVTAFAAERIQMALGKKRLIN